MKRILILTLALAILLPEAAVARTFNITRGTNIAHWLSQSGARGEQRANFFTERDVRQIAAWGFDHVRIPIDEEQMFTEDGKKIQEAFALLHQALGWCAKHDLRAIVDLHILRSHYFNAKEKPLFTRRDAQEHFYRLWSLLSDELKRYPVDRVAYELMNEPVADNPEIWNRIVRECYATLRAKEKRRFIVIGSNRWQSYDTVKDQWFPEKDKHVIVSFHYYNPMGLTHYEASWTDLKNYHGAVRYPGVTIGDADVRDCPESVRQEIRWNLNKEFNREVIKGHFRQVVEAVKGRGLQIYLGEYGCIRNAPEVDRYRWLTDVNSLCDEFGIARACWAYNEGGAGFGILRKDGYDREMVRIMTGN